MPDRAHSTQRKHRSDMPREKSVIKKISINVIHFGAFFISPEIESFKDTYLLISTTRLLLPCIRFWCFSTMSGENLIELGKHFLVQFYFRCLYRTFQVFHGTGTDNRRGDNRIMV